jgi:hypothetical protein
MGNLSLFATVDPATAVAAVLLFFLLFFWGGYQQQQSHTKTSLSPSYFFVCSFTLLSAPVKQGEEGGGKSETGASAASTLTTFSLFFVAPNPTTPSVLPWHSLALVFCLLSSFKRSGAAQRDTFAERGEMYAHRLQALRFAAPLCGLPCRAVCV